MKQKMNINRSNYEIFFLDYHEGHLPAGQEKLLFAFLEENPDLKEEFEAYEKLALKPAPDIYSNKNNLKRIDAVEAEKLFIAYYEGDLTAQENKRLQELLENEALRKEFLSYEKLRLKAAASYPFKEELKRTAFSYRLYRRVAAWTAAAAAVLLLILLLPSDEYNKTGETITARAKEIHDKKVKRSKENQLAHADSKFSSKQMQVKRAEKKQKEYSVERASIEKIIPIHPQVVISDEILAVVIYQPESTESNAISGNTTDEVFLTPKQFITQKIKGDSERVLTNQKFNAWDIASLAAKGISKLTGKKIKVEHNSHNGSFALAAGKLKVTNKSE